MNAKITQTANYQLLKIKHKIPKDKVLRQGVGRSPTYLDQILFDELAAVRSKPDNRIGAFFDKISLGEVLNDIFQGGLFKRDSLGNETGIDLFEEISLC